MGKSAKFFKRPTRKEKAIMALSKGSSESLYDEATADNKSGNKKKDPLAHTANPTISKKNKGADQPSKSSLALKMQMNGGVKQAIKDLRDLDRAVGNDDEEMADAHHQSSSQPKKQTSGEDKTRPRPDYVELMYGKPQSGKRKSFQPKPVLIK
ncbi:hypothetical protein BGW41_004268 [Actinomortierella wolfii]|nr:hypothetical protein BGW41_004268 [Actinomortierella wolfii]